MNTHGKRLSVLFKLFWGRRILNSIQAPLRTSHFSLHSSYSTLHTTHFTLHTSHCTLPYSSHSTLHTPHLTLHTSQSTLHTSHFSLLSSHSTLHTSHSTLHTALFTPHTSHCTLHTPHFISFELFSPYPSSSLLICHLSFMNHFPILLLRNLHAPCASQARACVLCAKLLLCCCPRTWPARNPGAMQCEANTFLTLHIAFFTLHTPHFTFALHFNSSHLSSSHLISCFPIICQLSSSWLFTCQLLCLLQKLAKTTSQYYLVLQSLHKALPSTTVYYKSCTNYFPVLSTTKLAQSTSQYYCVLQSLHKLLPNTTLYYKACTNYFPVLLSTTKLAQTTSQYWCLLQKLAKTTSQYYFVLQSLHKLLPSTTLYYKACTKHVPILLCTTKLAQSTSQYYLCIQSLHKALPSTTVYYKACTKHVPILLSTTKLAQSTSQYYFVLQSLHKLLPSTDVYYKSLQKLLPSTTLYYKACTKHFPVLFKLTAAPKPDFGALFTRIFKRKITSAEMEKICWQITCSYSNTIYNVQLQKRIVTLRMQARCQATLTQPLQCVLQHDVANPHLSPHMATPNDNNHAAIPMRSATRDSRNACNDAHRTNHSLQNTEEEPIRAWNDRSRTRRTHEVPCIAGCSHFTRKNTRFCSPASSPKHSPCNIHAAIQYVSQHHVANPHLSTHMATEHGNFPSSPLPIVTTSLPHHFPSSPLPIVTTSLPHHFPSSPLPIVTTSLPHHFPSSPLPFLTTSLRHHFPSSPLPIVTTSLPHHFPSSPLPIVTTSLPHHFPSSPLPIVTTSLPHHFPSSPLPFTPLFIKVNAFLMYCYAM